MQPQSQVYGINADKKSVLGGEIYSGGTWGRCSDTYWSSYNEK